MQLDHGRMILAARVLGPTGAAYARLRVDTGDDLTLVSPTVLLATGATPIAIADIVGIDGLPVQAPVYVVDLDLGPGLGLLQQVRVVGYPLSDTRWDGLFGDNLLDRCLLTRDGPSGTWSLQVVEATPPTPPTHRRLLAAAGAAAVLIGSGLALAAVRTL